MTQPNEKRPVGFTPAEIRVFKVHAVLVAAIAAGFWVTAPKGLGQVLGLLLAAALLPLPPLVIYLLRRYRADR